MFRAAFCDSQGLNRFLRLCLAAQRHGVHLVLATISTPLRHLLELTETLEVFQLADTVEQATVHHGCARQPGRACRFGPWAPVEPPLRPPGAGAYIRRLRRTGSVGPCRRRRVNDSEVARNVPAGTVPRSTANGK
ncbi:STAS domain-containing protein [Streptomyces sp. RKAG337]|uniref:STAS domain-containing protein n=1 Tax=Streptomyces sp. RKAG337 TaxID=2893404 RepID=UPI0020331E7E|nr:STAS domain-containing protein [Streptomyces sp. RKAG337]MCM2425052.1 hypothetical protein [Streptomyces sp. RKAG337]